MTNYKPSTPAASGPGAPNRPGPTARAAPSNSSAPSGVATPTRPSSATSAAPIATNSPPAPGSVARLARQAAHLWRVKPLIQQRLAQRLRAGDPLGLVDSRPLPACPFARATFGQRCRGGADYGSDPLLQRTCYGFRLHLRTSRDGVIRACPLAPARASAKAVRPELDVLSGSVGIGGRGSWGPALRERLAAGGVQLLAPYPPKSKEPAPARSARRASVRYRIEPVNGPLAERDGIKRTWARDRWHLCHRVLRKLLSHPVSIWLTVRAGIAPLSFDRLVTA